MGSPANAPRSIEEMVERYYRGYNDHDVEAVLSCQTDDAEYRLHGAETPKSWVGADACREVYEHHLASWPDQKLELRSLVVSNSLCACHLFVTGTLVGSWEMAGRTYQPTGRAIGFEIVHIMQCEDNLIKIKDGWIDGIAIHNQLSA